MKLSDLSICMICTTDYSMNFKDINKQLLKGSGIG